MIDKQDVMKMIERRVPSNVLKAGNDVVPKMIIEQFVGLPRVVSFSVDFTSRNYHRPAKENPPSPNRVPIKLPAYLRSKKTKESMARSVSKKALN